MSEECSVARGAQDEGRGGTDRGQFLVLAGFCECSVQNQ